MGCRSSGTLGEGNFVLMRSLMEHFMEENKKSHDEAERTAFKLPAREPSPKETKEAEDERKREELLQKVKHFIFDSYVPAESLREAAFCLTTQELYERAQERYPSWDYSMSDIATWLEEKGFRYRHIGLKGEWLLKTNKNG